MVVRPVVKYLCCASLAALLLLAGCDRKKDPILSLPGAGTTAVSMQCPQYDSRTFPEGRVYVLVTDQSGTPLTNFKIGNFTVLDNGNPAVLTKVSTVDTSREPLSVVICMDRSGSMYGSPTTDANAAAKQFIDSLGTNDAAAIVDFASEASLSLGFTTDKSRLKATIDAGTPSGLTALYDAMGLAAQEIRNRPGRKFIIAITDGWENASDTFTSREKVSDEINRSGVAGHIIGIGYDIDTASLDYIADITNGRFLSSPNASQLSTQFSYILNLMQNLVVVSYRSRENNTVGEITVYLNYGDITQSASRRYGA